MADDLERFVRGEPIKARRPSLPRRVREWRRRNTVLTAVMSAVLFTAFVSGVIARWRSEVRNAATEEAARLDLVEAARLLDGDRIDQAAQVLSAAKARLADTSTGAVRTQFDKLRKALDWQDRLDNARLQLLWIADRQSAGSAFEENGLLDYAGSEQAYDEIFKDNGLDVQATTVAQAAEIVASTPIRARLVRALDDWAHCRDHVAGADASKLRAIADRVDTNEWRKRLRNPSLSKNRTALEALATENAVLAQPPENLLQLASFLEDVNARRASVHLLRRSQQTYPGDFWTNYRLALSILRSPDQSPETLAEAIPYCRAALALQPRSAAVHLTLAWSLRHQGHEKAREAEAASRVAVGLRFDDAYPHIYLGLCLADQGRNAEAIEAFQEALKHSPHRAHFSAYYNLGHEYWRQGLSREAVAAFRKASEIAPERPIVYSTLRTAYAQLGNASEAKKFSRLAEAGYRRAISHNGNDYASYVNLGCELDHQGRHDEAEETLRQAIDFVPDMAEAHKELGVVYYNRGKFAESEAAFRKACQVGESARTHFLLGCALGQQGKLADSAKSVRKAIELKPDYQDAITTLIYVLKKDRESVWVVRGLLKAKSQLNDTYATLLLRCADVDDPDALDADERVAFRTRALEYFQSSLVAEKDKLAKRSSKASHRVESKMRAWLDELGLRHLRREDDLAKLPDPERSAWRKLWRDADELRKQATPQGGFIQSWLVLSDLIPYQGTSGVKALEQEQMPGEALLHPRAGDTVEVQGKTLLWREHHSSEVYIDLAPQGSLSEHKVAYAVCYVHADAERSDLKICVGSDDQAKLYLNGKAIHQVSALRPLVLDQDEIAPVSLRKGSNVLVFKVVNQTQIGPLGSVRFLTADGRIPEGIEFRLAP